MSTPAARLRTLRENAGLPGWWTDAELETFLQGQSIPKCKAERDRLEAVADLGCCICRVKGRGYRPAEVHHLRTRPDGQKYGAAERASHLETIPLCPTHHRLGPLGIAFHSGERTWEAQFFPELYLLEFTNSWLEIVSERTDPIPDGGRT
ncbi:Ref family recombination enhancement nuclease [Mesoterricola silvestris]|uniref:DUF968 domain-containing protein n=1 Tax=Mesoterricola silvestris TaxID=2927979 RepID=A0AA48KBX6_9BACT|nr:Ref family recombination enhancement nuclease [Mesoterricola silvestris]BDU72938.1 hypothetical protein METEAL_21120 [Mesoterricola silvestris]